MLTDLMRRSSGSTSLNVRLLSLLLASHLLLLLLLSDHVGVLLLLSEERPGLMGLLLQVLHVGDEADRVHNALVVEEHTCDLACGLAVVLLNDLIDIVTDFLATLVGFEALEALKIHTAHQRLGGRLLLLLSKHLLLLLGHHLRVIRRHLLHLLLGSTGGGLRLLRRNRSSRGLLLLLLLLVSFTATTLAHVVSLSTSTVVKLVTTLTTIVLALLTLTLVVIVIRASALVALTADLLAAVLAALVGENSSHEVLLNFLEATLLALLVQFVGWHPELD